MTARPKNNEDTRLVFGEYCTSTVVTISAIFNTT